MADRHVDHLLIGGGIASASAAAALRAAGASGSVAVIGRELDAPYHRPPATKGYLTGVQDKASAQIHPEGWWAEHDVELLVRTGVLSLDPAAKEVKLATKEVVSYSTALVATGAMVRRLMVDGSDLDGLHYIRALGNADAIRKDLEEAAAKEVVLVGGSYIGCEVAASLAQLGYRCTILMQEDEPMQRGVGPIAGAWVRGQLEANGITVRGGVDVEGFAGSGERIEEVLLAGGDRVRADVVVAGVGVTPDVMLAKKAGLPIGPLGGVQCDAGLRVDGHDGLWAAGDMCEFASVLHGTAKRIEHEEVARTHGEHVGRAMAGADEPYREVPYFWSDLGDWGGLEHIGAASEWATEDVTGDAGGHAFGITYKDAEGRTVAALSVNGGMELDAARAEIASRG